MNELFDPQVLKAVLRTRLLFFFYKVFFHLHPGKQLVYGWYQEAICYYLCCMMDGDTNRVAITIPPRMGKSLIGTVSFAAWVLGLDPTRKIIIVSYSEDVVKKHMRDLREVVNAAWYRALFPGFYISKAKDTETEFVTTKKGGVYATTIGGSVTGLGADIIIIDDPTKPQDMNSEPMRKKANDYYGESLITRLDDPASGKIVLIQQRLHVDDLVANVTDNEDYWHLNLPAVCDKYQDVMLSPHRDFAWHKGELLAPERLSQEVLDRQQRIMGSLLYSAQYMQHPVPLAGNMVLRDWFVPYDRKGLKSSLFVQAWDTATETGDNNDYSVCLTFALIEDRAYLVHIFREKLIYPELEKAALEGWQQFKPERILVENANVGNALIHYLKKFTDAKVMWGSPTVSKEERLASHSYILEQRLLHLPVIDGKYPEAVEKYVTELTSFPGSKHDDMVDATTLFLRWYAKYGPGPYSRYSKYGKLKS